MRRYGGQILFGAGLILASVLLYAFHYLCFHDLHHIMVYLIGDIAFVPIEVLLVTLVIHEMLKVREKRALMQKMNMAIGLFFSEVGTTLCAKLQQFDPNSTALVAEFRGMQEWSDARFVTAGPACRARALDSRRGNLADLKTCLTTQREFLLRLLGNPNLLEHESFTDLLWAVFHLEEELAHRECIEGLPADDAAHLSGDMNRAYGLLLQQWLAYMRHLKSDYPYLFSLAVRMSPFDPDAQVQIGGPVAAPTPDAHLAMRGTRRGSRRM